MTDQGRTGGIREPEGSWTTVELKEYGANMEPMGREAVVESRARMPKVELGNQHTREELESWKPKADLSRWEESAKEESKG